MFITTLPAFFCNSPDSSTIKSSEYHSDWLNVYDTSVRYVGMDKCRACHEPVYQDFIKTGMGQSWDDATKEKSAANFSADHALVYDDELDFYYKPYWQENKLHIMEFRLKGKDTVHKLVQEIDYVVGSGQHTNSHIYNVNGYLYQAPITYYTQKGKWDLAPGFEKGASSRFNRMIQLECMSCHNALPDFVAESQNKYLTIKHGIDCERCHGPGSLHVQEKTSGNIIDTSKGPDYTIVNPARLSIELQNNVCQRCHLQGIAVLNDNKTFFDFRPGMKLSEVMNVFMPEYEGGQDKMIMASHVERMKKSECFVSSGEMSCITCHKPHVSVKFTPQSQYLNACKSCHGGNEGVLCSEDLVVRNKGGNNCITCHMPKNGSIDIPHVAVTDHYIRKQPLKEEDKGKITRFLGLQCFNNDEVDAITKARGYMEFYERYNAEDNTLLDSALLYLNKDKERERAQMQNRDFIRLYYLLNDYPNVIKLVREVEPVSINDAWTAYRIGEGYYQTGNTASALPWLKQSVILKPLALDFRNKYATALAASEDIDGAIEQLKKIISENPRYANAHSTLGYIYMQQGVMTLSYDHLSKALHYMPDNKQVLINLAVWHHTNKEDIKAKKYLEHLLSKYPDDKQGKAMLLDLL